VRRLFYLAMSLSFLLGVLLAGCASNETASKDVWDDGGKKEVKAPENAKGAEKDELAAQGGGKSSGSASERLRALEKEKDLREKQQDFLVAQYLRSAQNLLNEGQPHAALKEIEKALQVKPGHVKATEMRYRVEVMLGLRPGEVGAAASEMEKLVSVKIEEAKIEARNHFRKAENFYKAFRFEDAIGEFTKVLEIIRWAPYHIDLAGYRERVEAYLHRCRKLKALERAKRLKALQAKTWEIAKAEERMSKRLQMQKVELIFKEAVLQFEQKHYKKAERLAQRVLDLNPRHKLARRLIEDCIEARHTFNEKRYVSQTVEEWKKPLEDFQESKVP